VCDSEADDYSVTRSHERVRAEGEQHSTETKKEIQKHKYLRTFISAAKFISPEKYFRSNLSLIA